MSTQFRFWTILAVLTPLTLLTVTPTVAEQRTLAVEPSAAGHRSIGIPGIPKRTQWVNPPAAFGITRHGIEITASAKTEKYIAADGSFMSDTANRLLFEADTDFILSALISHPFANRWDAGGLVLEGDAENWIKFCFEKDYTGANRVVSVVTRGTSDDSNSVAFDARQAYFQIAKIGDVVFLYASEIGKPWYLVRVLNFKFEGKLRVGFLAQTPEGESNKVSFTHIKYQPTAMKDYWKGE